jgi:hypothetical protein
MQQGTNRMAKTRGRPKLNPDKVYSIVVEPVDPPLERMKCPHCGACRADGWAWRGRELHCKACGSVFTKSGEMLRLLR